MYDMSITPAGWRYGATLFGGEGNNLLLREGYIPNDG